MANLTHNVSYPTRVPAGGFTERSIPMLGYTNNANTAYKAFKGAVIMGDASKAAGYGAPILDTPVATDVFFGIATERQIVGDTVLADGAKYITVSVDGVYALPANAITRADVGKIAFATDDLTIVVAATGGLAIGTIVDVDATNVWVDISDHAGKVSVATL